MAEEGVFGNFDLTHKVGPLPIYGWIVAAGGLGYVLFKMGFGKLAAGKGQAAGGSSPGQGTTFQSSQSKTTTDAQGNQTQANFSAQGDGYLPGMLTYGAGPMPYQQGDVYVNVSGTNTTQPPPGNKGGIYPPGVTQGFWYTTPREMAIQEVAQNAYQLPDYNSPNAGIGPDYVTLALFSMWIQMANPGVSMVKDNLYPTGTKLFIPGLPTPQIQGTGSTGKQPSKWDNWSGDWHPFQPVTPVPVPQSTTTTAAQ